MLPNLGDPYPPEPNPTLKLASTQVVVIRQGASYVEQKPVVVSAGGHIFLHVSLVDHINNLIIQDTTLPLVKLKSKHRTPIRLWPVSVYSIINWPVNESNRYPHSPHMPGQ